LLARPELLIFALAVTLFHFANAAMLPLAGQLLSTGKTTGASLYMSACIIAAQLVMIPVAALAGTFADRWGRKPVFLIGFAALPIRGCLYTFSDDPVYIVMVQLLDGIGAGIFGVLWVTVVADLTKGTGRYNVTLGAIATAQSIGAALSNLAAGYVVQLWGYPTAFLSLAGVAAMALFLFYWAMPETKDARAYIKKPEHLMSGTHHRMFKKAFQRGRSER
jgi:MFS family permease